MTDGRPRLYLIDTSSYVFRAFFALPRLSNSAGLPTNAIYGFVTMTLKLLKEQKPELLAAVLDVGRETFRNEMYREYKGNRPEAPADLVPQFPYVQKALEAMNVPVVGLEGFEADDIIATLARSFSAQGIEVIIVTGDKDLMQLVGESVRILNTTKTEWVGVDDVKRRFGVEPQKVVEVMGLMGDSIDNIPGVKGIGEKTAIALIQQFQSIENLYDHLDELERAGLKGPARVRKALVEGKEAAFLSRDLATVRTDVPMEVGLDRLRYKQPDREKLRELFTELEFTKLLKGLDDETAAEEPPPG